MKLTTKQQRDETRQYLFNKHIEAGFLRETYKGLEIFTKEEYGKYYAHVYLGNSTKDINKYCYRDPERLEAAISEFKRSYDMREEWKANKTKNDKLTAAEAEKKAANGETVEASTRKSTILLKKYIKEKYNIECNIKSESFSGGNSLNISYKFGCDDENLSDIKTALCDSGFDGMQDLKYNIDCSSIIIDGFKLETFNFVNIKQEISEEFIKKCSLMLSDAKIFDVPDLLPDFSNYNTSFNKICRRAWTWAQLIYQSFRKRNFVTQDESKINLISCHYDDTTNGEIYFKYSVDGLDGIFDTRQYILPINKNKSISESKTTNFEPVEVEAGKINVVDYSEKAIAIIGDTKPVKDILKSLGGKFNFRLSCGPGWIFPKSKQEQIIEALKNEAASKKQQSKNEIRKEIQETVNFFADTDIELNGEISEKTKQIASVQKCDINGVQEYNKLQDIEEAANEGKIISLYNLANVINKTNAAT